MLLHVLVANRRKEIKTKKILNFQQKLASLKITRHKVVVKLNIFFVISEHDLLEGAGTCTMYSVSCLFSVPRFIINQQENWDLIDNRSQ